MPNDNPWFTMEREGKTPLRIPTPVALRLGLIPQEIEVPEEALQVGQEVEPGPGGISVPYPEAPPPPQQAPVVPYGPTPSPAEPTLQEPAQVPGLGISGWDERVKEAAPTVEDLPVRERTPFRIATGRDIYKERAGLREGQVAASSDVYQEGTEDMATYMAGRDKQRAELQKTQDDFWANSKQLRQEFSDLQEGPGLWEKLSTPQKIGGLIAVFIKGFYNPRGENTALQMFERMIERDLKEKQAKLRAKAQEVGMADNILSRNIQLVGDFERGTALTRAQMWDDVARRAEAEAQKYASPLARTEEQLKALQFDMQGDAAIQAQLDKEWDKAYKGEQLHEQALQWRGAQSTARRGQTLDYNARMAAISQRSKGGQKISTRDQIALAKWERELASEESSRAIRDLRAGATGDPIGRITKNLDDPSVEAHKVRYPALIDLIENIDAFMVDVDKIGRVYGGFGKDKLGSETAKALDGLYNDIVLTRIAALSGKAFTQPEIDMMKKIIPAPSTWTSRKNIMKSWERFRKHNVELISKSFRDVGVTEDQFSVKKGLWFEVPEMLSTGGVERLDADKLRFMIETYSDPDNSHMSNMADYAKSELDRRIFTIQSRSFVTAGLSDEDKAMLDLASELGSDEAKGLADSIKGRSGTISGAAEKITGSIKERFGTP